MFSFPLLTIIDCDSLRTNASLTITEADSARGRLHFKPSLIPLDPHKSSHRHLSGKGKGCVGRQNPQKLVRNISQQKKWRSWCLTASASFFSEKNKWNKINFELGRCQVNCSSSFIVITYCAILNFISCVLLVVISVGYLHWHLPDKCSHLLFSYSFPLSTTARALWIQFSGSILLLLLFSSPPFLYFLFLPYFFFNSF